MLPDEGSFEIGLYDAELDGAYGRLDPVGSVEFADDVLHVRLDGRSANYETAGDLRVVLPLGHQTQ